MGYATQQDLVDRFGETELAQLTDRDTAAFVDAAVLSRALADADAEIDGYLAARFTLPLTVVPPILVRLAADIARFRLYDDRATEQVRTRYEDAVRLLREVAAGRFVVDGATPLGSTAAVPVLARTAERLFSDELLSGY